MNCTCSRTVYQGMHCFYFFLCIEKEDNFVRVNCKFITIKRASWLLEAKDFVSCFKHFIHNCKKTMQSTIPFIHPAKKDPGPLFCQEYTLLELKWLQKFNKSGSGILVCMLHIYILSLAISPIISKHSIRCWYLFWVMGLWFYGLFCFVL